MLFVNTHCETSDGMDLRRSRPGIYTATLLGTPAHYHKYLIVQSHGSNLELLKLMKMI